MRNPFSSPTKSDPLDPVQALTTILGRIATTEAELAKAVEVAPDLIESLRRCRVAAAVNPSEQATADLATAERDAAAETRLRAELVSLDEVRRDLQAQADRATRAKRATDAERLIKVLAERRESRNAKLLDLVAETVLARKLAGGAPSGDLTPLILREIGSRTALHTRIESLQKELLHG